VCAVGPSPALLDGNWQWLDELGGGSSLLVVAGGALTNATLWCMSSAADAVNSGKRDPAGPPSDSLPAGSVVGQGSAPV